MKKLLIALPLLLLVACNTTTSTNSSNSSSNSFTTSTKDTSDEKQSSDITSNSKTTSSDSINEEDTYKVIGYFKDNKNAPIKDINLGLFNKDKERIDTYITDSDGKFIFEGVQEGSYYLHILTIESDKYKNVDRDFNFEVSGDNHEIQLDAFILEIDSTKWSDLV